ncbi:esterase/lipase family protein (plasmid) [Niallia taxi]|uniref:esterase/lipase family protein n=1 Tax=Niallia taxi TaxID=2499688 RepID=UPI003F5F9D82
MKNTKLLISLVACMAIFVSVVGIKPSVSKAASSHDPVIYVHGTGGNSTNFFAIKSYLKTQGWADNELYAIELIDKTGNSYTNAKQLATYVDQVLKKTGKSKVDIIGHSAGGINTLTYILNTGGSKVNDVVTLGSPNRFITSTAPVGKDSNHKILYTSIYSSSDYLVPTWLSNLKGAKNVQLSGIGHLGLVANSKVNELIKAGLNGGGQNTN